MSGFFDNITRASTLADLAPGGSYGFGNGTAAAPSISFQNDPDTGIYRLADNQLWFTVGGNFVLGIGANGRLIGARSNNYIDMVMDGAIALTASGTNQNITLTPSGTGSVQFRSVSLPEGAIQVVHQGFVSGVSGSGIVVGQVSTTGNVASRIQAFTNGGNSHGPIFINPVGGNILFGTTTDSGNGRIQLATHTTSAGGIGFGTDLALFRSAAGILSLLPSSGSSQFTLLGTNGFLTAQGSLVLQSSNGVTALTLDSSQNATFAKSLTIGNTSVLGWLGRSYLSSALDGVILLSNNAVTDFSRLQFGGTSNAFPALKRSGTQLQVRLADDSGSTELHAGSYSIGSTARSIISGSGSPEGVYTAGIGSLYLRNDGGAGTTLYVKETGTGNTGWVAK